MLPHERASLKKATTRADADAAQSGVAHAGTAGQRSHGRRFRGAAAAAQEQLPVR